MSCIVVKNAKTLRRIDLSKNIWRSPFQEQMAWHKGYLKPGFETWELLAEQVVQEVCIYMSKEDKSQLTQYITEMKFLPGGRYLYYAGRGLKYYNNCFLFNALEDTREDWARLVWKSMAALMTGGGIGNVYTKYRPKGKKIKRTGGLASGPINIMEIVNEVGRGVSQGGSRRSAIWGGLHWYHDDIPLLMEYKNWDAKRPPGCPLSYGELKRKDLMFPAPLDCTNISAIYDDTCFETQVKELQATTILRKNIEQAMRTGEPGMSFNFGQDKINEYLRNACCEIVSDTESDICNIGSLNFPKIKDKAELEDVIRLAMQFLVCGTLTAEVPFDEVRKARSKNRRLGLGKLGVHEQLLMWGDDYSVTSRLRSWLEVYENASKQYADEFCDKLGISRPRGYRADAPNGSLMLITGTTSGIEPVFSVAYKRKYLELHTQKYQFIVDTTAKYIMETYNIPADKIETAYSLSENPEKRIKFQADIQEYVDQGISSTVNLPAWGSEHNNESKVGEMTRLVQKYWKRLRGITFYPDGARWGQPFESVDYEYAKGKEGVEFEEKSHDVCELSNKSTCG